MSKYDYPRLPRDEILEILSAANIATVSASDLLHPDPDFICNLYNQVLLNIGMQEESEQMEFGALQQLDIPEHHVHSVPIMNLYKRVRQLLVALECPEPFTLKDLMKPEADLNEYFLGALLNFYVFREARLNQLKPILDEVEQLEERKRASQDRIAQLSAEIAELEEARERELPFIQELSSQVNELNQKVTDRNKHQMQLKTSIKELKEKSVEMDEKISNAEFALVQSVQENANLRSKIVQSPDKLQRALEEKKALLIEAKNAEREARMSFQDKTATLEAREKACKKMSKHLARLQSVQEQVNQAKADEKDLKALKKKLSDDLDLDKLLDAKIVELQSRADQLNEYKTKLEKEIAHNNEAAERELNNVKLEVELKRRALEERQKNVESKIVEAEVINSRIRKVKEDGEGKKRALQRKLEEVVVALHNYKRKIDDALMEEDPQIDGECTFRAVLTSPSLLN